MTIRIIEADQYPKEAWRGQVDDGEFALFCVDGMTGIPTDAENGRPGGLKVCRISADRAELEELAREIVSKHSNVVCKIYAANGRVTKSIQNDRVARQIGLVFLALYFVLALAGSAFLYMILWLTGWTLFTYFGLDHPKSVAQWVAFLAVGSLLAFVLVAGSIWVVIKRASLKMEERVRNQLKSPWQ